MVDFRPLLFLNALALMLLMTAGFAHVRQSDIPSAAPVVMDEAQPASLSGPATVAEVSSQTEPPTSDPIFMDQESESDINVASESDTTDVFVSETGTDEPGVVVASVDANLPDTSSQHDYYSAPEAAAVTSELAAPPVTAVTPSSVPAVKIPEPPVPTTGKLIVRSNVAGDKVTINGRPYGSTALNLDLDPGQYVIVVTKTGFQDWTRTVEVVRGGQRTVVAQMDPVTIVNYRNGTWQLGVVTGDGTYVGSDGTRYTGGFLNKEFHGKGKLTLADGSTYEGEFSSGNKHGYGTLKLASGDTYVGQFKDDLFNGDGTLTKANGDIYTGFWANGKLNGDGSLTTKQGLMYVGGFIDNEFSGNGTVTYPDGTHYEGGFSKGIYHGKGVLTYSDGKKYTGQFIEGQFHGKGELQNPNGSKISGTFKFGKPYGQATLTTPEGEIFTARSNEPGVCYRLKSYRATQCPPMEGW